MHTFDHEKIEDAIVVSPPSRTEGQATDLTDAQRMIQAAEDAKTRIRRAFITAMDESETFPLCFTIPDMAHTAKVTEHYFSIKAPAILKEMDSRLVMEHYATKHGVRSYKIVVKEQGVAQEPGMCIIV